MVLGKVTLLVWYYSVSQAVKEPDGIQCIYDNLHLRFSLQTEFEAMYVELVQLTKAFAPLERTNQGKALNLYLRKTHTHIHIYTHAHARAK